MLLTNISMFHSHLIHCEVSISEFTPTTQKQISGQNQPTYHPINKVNNVNNDGA